MAWENTGRGYWDSNLDMEEDADDPSDIDLEQLASNILARLNNEKEATSDRRSDFQSYRTHERDRPRPIVERGSLIERDRSRKEDNTPFGFNRLAQGRGKVFQPDYGRHARRPPVAGKGPSRGQPDGPASASRFGDFTRAEVLKKWRAAAGDIGAWDRDQMFGVAPAPDAPSPETLNTSFSTPTPTDLAAGSPEDDAFGLIESTAAAPDPRLTRAPDPAEAALAGATNMHWRLSRIIESFGDTPKILPRTVQVIKPSNLPNGNTGYQGTILEREPPPTGSDGPSPVPYETAPIDKLDKTDTAQLQPLATAASDRNAELDSKKVEDARKEYEGRWKKQLEPEPPKLKFVGDISNEDANNLGQNPWATMIMEGFADEPVPLPKKRRKKKPKKKMKKPKFVKPPRADPNDPAIVNNPVYQQNLALLRAHPTIAALYGVAHFLATSTVNPISRLGRDALHCLRDGVMAYTKDNPDPQPLVDLFAKFLSQDNIRLLRQNLDEPPPGQGGFGFHQPPGFSGFNSYHARTPQFSIIPQRFGDPSPPTIPTNVLPSTPMSAPATLPAPVQTAYTGSVAPTGTFGPAGPTTSAINFPPPAPAPQQIFPTDGPAPYRGSFQGAQTQPTAMQGGQPPPGPMATSMPPPGALQATWATSQASWSGQPSAQPVTGMTQGYPANNIPPQPQPPSWAAPASFPTPKHFVAPTIASAGSEPATTSAGATNWQQLSGLFQAQAQSQAARPATTSGYRAIDSATYYYTPPTA